MSSTETRMLEELKLRLFQLYAFFGTPTIEWDIESPKVQEVLPTHTAWLRGLESAGVMFMGGPFRADDYAWNGSGMIIVRANSLADARELAEQDPLFIHGLREYDVRGWQLNEGRIVLTLDLDSNVIGVA